MKTQAIFLATALTMMLIFIGLGSILLSESNVNPIVVIESSSSSAVPRPHAAAATSSPTPLPAPPIRLAMLVFPSLLGPEDLPTSRERTLACLESWWHARHDALASVERRRARSFVVSLFVVQWFGDVDVVDAPTLARHDARLLRVPSEHNGTYASRVFWAMREIDTVGGGLLDALMKVDDVTFVLLPNVFRFLLEQRLTDFRIWGHRCVVFVCAFARAFADAAVCGSGCAAKRCRDRSCLAALGTS